MKRFNIGIHEVTKDNRFVYFPPVLDMAPYCTTQCFEVCMSVHAQVLYLYCQNIDYEFLIYVRKYNDNAY